MCPIAPSGPPSRDPLSDALPLAGRADLNRLLTSIANEQTMPAHPAPLLLAA